MAPPGITAPRSNESPLPNGIRTPTPASTSACSTAPSAGLPRAIVFTSETLRSIPDERTFAASQPAFGLALGHAPVAQWIERPPPEREAAGSNPAGRAPPHGGASLGGSGTVGVAAILLLWRGCGNPGFGGGSGVRSGRPQRRRRTASVASTSASLSKPPSAPWTNRSDCSRSYGAGTGILLAAAALAASFLGREAFGGDPARGVGDRGSGFARDRHRIERLHPRPES